MMPRKLLAQQRADEMANPDIGVGVVLDLDLAIDRPDRPALDYVRRAVAKVHVGLEASEVEHEVRLVHPRHNRGRTDRADMHAHVERMVHRKRALAEHRGEHRRAHVFGEIDQLPGRLEAMDLDACD